MSADLDAFPLIDAAGPLGFAFSAGSADLLGWDDPAWVRQQLEDDKLAAAIVPYVGPGMTRILWRRRGRVCDYGRTTYRPGYASAWVAWAGRQGIEAWAVPVAWQSSLIGDDVPPEPPPRVLTVHQRGRKPRAVRVDPSQQVLPW